jgi:hypothetical protein
MPTIGSRYIASWADKSNPLVWIVKGITKAGIYLTCSESRSVGHLLSPKEFARDYIAL